MAHFKKSASLLAAAIALSMPLAAFSQSQGGNQPQGEVSKRDLIAVTDLSYESKIAQYFVKYDRKSSSSQSHSGHAGGFGGSSQSQDSVHYESGREVVIDRGELRRFTADIKGELIKSGKFSVVQGKPWTKADTDTLYDIIGRIKAGYYPGAKYVLFGSVSAFDVREDNAPIIGSNAFNHSLTYDMTVEMSLISTSNYKVVAAFSAQAEGSDNRLESGRVNHPLSSSKAISAMSKALGESVRKQLDEQVNGFQ